mmetsp:Transcript_22373/g.51524  ORF Transcript_22373/g.51524 Transcript_22373/m.51524 type:complete len:275 (+) Transcript_22373:2296-3120(+)
MCEHRIERRRAAGEGARDAAGASEGRRERHATTRGPRGGAGVRLRRGTEQRGGAAARALARADAREEQETRCDAEEEAGGAAAAGLARDGAAREPQDEAAAAAGELGADFGRCEPCFMRRRSRLARCAAGQAGGDQGDARGSAAAVRGEAQARAQAAGARREAQGGAQLGAAEAGGRDQGARSAPFAPLDARAEAGGVCRLHSQAGRAPQGRLQRRATLALVGPTDGGDREVPQGAAEVGPREQEGARPVRQLQRAARQAARAQGGAGRGRVVD